MKCLYGGETVQVSNEPSLVAPYWRGKFGKVIRWVFNSWYVVKVEDEELMLDFARHEFSIVEEVTVTSL